MKSSYPATAKNVTFRLDHDTIKKLDKVVEYLSGENKINVKKVEGIRFLLRFWEQNRDKVK